MVVCPNTIPRESRILKEGETITTVETPYGKIGVGICYDIRFPELSIAMRSAGAILLCFPGAFNMVTGPAHWELLQRSRAVDTQVGSDYDRLKETGASNETEAVRRR